MNRINLSAGQGAQARPDLYNAVRFNFDQLARIYSEARADYIVPMPMNARRMQDYVRFYDVDLSASFVSMNDGDEATGVAMLGLRDDRAWLTRLGVVPAGRGRMVGYWLVDAVLEAARERGATQVQLEVIEGNEPAYWLFQKFGFLETRRLFVIRRPPAPMPPPDERCTIELLDADGMDDCLDNRRDGPSWIEESASLRNAGGMHGTRITLNDGRSGWIVYTAAAFQLSHFTLDAPDPEVAYLLLAAVHNQHPQMDTKIENLPANTPYGTAFQHAGYIESFRRIEMLMRL